MSEFDEIMAEFESTMAEFEQTFAEYEAEMAQYRALVGDRTEQNEYDRVMSAYREGGAVPQAGAD
jgi:hypothetical protein